MLWILAQIGSQWGRGDWGVEEGVYDELLKSRVRNDDAADASLEAPFQ